MKNNLWSDFKDSVKSHRDKLLKWLQTAAIIILMEGQNQN